MKGFVDGRGLNGAADIRVRGMGEGAERASMQDFYGWRARIGLIYPSSSTVMEPELYAMAPEGVSIHTTRQDIGTIDVEGLRNWVGDDIVERCTRQLAQARIHSII